MSKYETLDALILDAVAARVHPFGARPVLSEADRLARETGRADFRVIDGRLQALRKAGRIKHLTKAESNGSAGWVLA